MVGDAAVRHRAAVLLAWCLLLVGTGVAAVVIGPADRPPVPSTPAQEALDRLEERIPGAGDPTGWAVLVAPEGGTVDDPAVARVIDTLVAGLREVPGVSAVVDPATGGTVSGDRRTAVVPVAVTASTAAQTRSRVDALAESARAGGPAVDLGGALAAADPGLGSGAALSLAAGVLLAAVVAGLTLASWRGAVLAVGTALVGAGTGMAVAVLAGRPFGLTAAGAAVAFLTGLAVGAAGAVLLLGRGGRPTAVLGGGLLTVLATTGLAVTGIEALIAVGVAASVVVAVAVLATLTLLPAAASLVGDPPPPPTGPPGRWGRLVIARPVVALGAAAAVLALAVVPAVVVDGDRAGAAASRAEELLAAAFGPGAAGPLLLTVEVDRPDKLAAALPAVARRVRTMEGVSLAAPGRVAADGMLGVVTVLPATGPADPATRDLVHRLRGPIDGAGVTVEVTGATAVAVDVADAVTGGLPRYLLVIGPIGLALLILLVRPWRAGIAAAIGSVLSVAAAALLSGAVGSWAGGWAGRGWVPGPDAATAVVALAVLLGLVLDQAVRAAASSGRGGRRTVGGAAVLVAALFGAMLLPARAGTGGVALAVVIGVLLDAGVIRLTMLPAVLALGRHRAGDAEPAEATAPPGAHAARGAHSAEAGDGRRVIEEALAAPEVRPGGRHRGG